MGINERKEREKLQRTSQILESARSLFIEKGYASTTMQDIADRAELGRRTLYMYFRTKDEIVSSIARDIILEVNRLVQNASVIPGNGRERMKGVTGCFVEYYKSRPDDFLLILNADFNSNLIIEGSDGKNVMADFLSTLTAMLSDILEAGFSDGTLRKSEEPTRLTARTMITSILGTLKMLALYPVGEKERDEQLVILIRMITNYVNLTSED